MLDFDNGASRMKAEEQNASTHTFMPRDCVVHCRRRILNAVLRGLISIVRYSRSTAARRVRLVGRRILVVFICIGPARKLVTSL